MKRFAMSGLTLLIAGTVVAVVPAVSPVGAQPPPVARQDILIEPQQGADIYTHTTGSDYRTSPALVTGIGNSLTQYTCGPTGPGSNEVIRSRTSSNGGGTWTPEQIVLQPSPGPDDARVCDPTLVKVATYYYLAYTGTSTTGTSRIFLARSTSLGGPFTKWNGTDWNGGTPAPLNTGSPGSTEASGPSLVIKDGTVHLYYNTQITTGPAAGSYQTRLATASLGTSTQQPTWPTRLTPQPGVAIEQPRKYTGLDCVGNHWWADTDVKYDDTTGRWLAITSDQGYPWFALQAYESTDGRTFSKAVITRGDYHQGARTPGQLADNTGHITPGNSAIAYARSTGCGWADLHATTTTQHQVKTGGIVETLRTSVANWHPDSGTWGLTPSFYRQSDTSTTLLSETSLTGQALSGTSTISVHMKGGDVNGTWGRIGVHFGKVHPDDTKDESGYTVYLMAGRASGNGWNRLILDKAGFGQMVSHPLPIHMWDDENTLRIIQSNGAIKVNLNGVTEFTFAVTDADHPYLGGYVGLVTQNASGGFRELVAGDNVAESTTTRDWLASSGDWTVGNRQLANSLNDGQLNLQTWLNETLRVPSELGDGTYAATVRVAAGADPRSWAGLALTNNGVTGSWASDGYLVFLRANGNLGIHKGGVGQVVADVPTGKDPTTHDVRVRVFKTGANMQVFLDDDPDPVVNWTDTSPPAWAIGGFGVANLLAPATFTDVTYNGNDAR